MRRNAYAQTHMSACMYTVYPCMSLRRIKKAKQSDGAVSQSTTTRIFEARANAFVNIYAALGKTRAALVSTDGGQGQAQASPRLSSNVEPQF